VSSKQDTNKISDTNSIDRCCEEFESIFVVTYSSWTWLVCNHCIDTEGFKSGITNRVRISG
jgi:hypothetical protein